MRKQIREYFKGKKIALLGFGKEGRSSLLFLQKLKVDFQVNVYDGKDIALDNKDKTINVFGGVDFSKIDFSSYDMLLKSPGIPFKKIKKKYHNKIQGQTSLFLSWYGSQCIGITGTKGKSTCTSLTHHLLKECGVNALIGGNIGTPLFELIPKLKKNTWVVAELSCHQLFKTSVSPHIAVLLNLYEEHLDYYKNAEEYFRSKLNVYLHQTPEDYFIYNKDDKRIVEFMKEGGVAKYVSIALKARTADFKLTSANELRTNRFRGRDKKVVSPLMGRMNYYNVLPALAVGQLLGLRKAAVFDALKNFKPLPHRLELVGKYQGVTFVNDSISTIPETCIAAVKALGDVDCLILGGYDRGIDYNLLVDFLIDSKITNLVFFDRSGERIFDEIMEKDAGLIDERNTFVTSDFETCIKFCLDNTRAGKTCLLSPASSSYGIFKNFEDRGEQFKELVKRIG